MNSTDTDELCRICEVSKRKYICPKCGIPYCSLQCYQNLEKHCKCSELFYRECVEEEVKSEGDPIKSKEMCEILNRFHEEYNKEDADLALENDGEDDIDSDDDEPLYQRMEGVNLDDPDQIWNSLTIEEKENFKRFVKKAEVSDTMSEWIPWWNVRIQKVREISKAEEQTSSSSFSVSSMKLNDDQPDHFHPIPAMSSLTKVPPSDFVKYGLVNVIGAYTWTIRLFNGDFVDASNQAEIAFAFVMLSSFLTENQVFSSSTEALRDIEVCAARIPDLLDGGPGLRRCLQKDMYSILTGGLSEPLSALVSKKKLSKSYVLSAISECYQLLSMVVKKLKKLRVSKKISSTINVTEPVTTSFSSVQGKELESFNVLFPINSNYKLESQLANSSLRKLYYLLAFANEFDVL